MLPTPATIQFGPVGWMVFLAFLVALVSRLLKADMLNTRLIAMGLPSLPKVAVPWIALGLGFTGGTLEAKIGGQGWSDACLMGAWGLLSGTAAITSHEALEKPVRALLGDTTGNVLFGKPTVLAEATRYGTPPPVIEVHPGVMESGAPSVIVEEKTKKSANPGDSMGGMVVAFLFLLFLGYNVSGCAALAGAAPVIAEIAVVAADANDILSAINLAEQAFFVQHPDPELQKKIQQAELDARLALNTAVRAANLAKDLQDKDVLAAIADFQKAYASLTDLLKQIGVASSDGTMKMASGRVVRLPQPMLLKIK